MLLLEAVGIFEAVNSFAIIFTIVVFIVAIRSWRDNNDK